MADADTSIALASSGDAADAGADRDDRETDRHDGGHERAEHDQQHEQRDQQADAGVAGGLVLGVEEDGVTAELDLDAGHLDAGDGIGEDRERRLPHLPLGYVEGQLGEADPAVLRDGAGLERVGHATRRGRTWRRRSAPRRSRPGDSSSDSPSSTAKTTRTLPLAASGKFSSSSSRARALWLPGAEKSSTKVPPPLAARKNIVPITTTHDAMVRHGCRRACHCDASGEPVHDVLPFRGWWLSWRAVCDG